MEQTELNTPVEAPQAPQTPERKRRAPAPKPRNPLPGFLSQIGRDVRWYFDIRLWSPVLLVLLILCTCTGSKLAASSTAKEYDAVIEEMEADWDEEREELLKQNELVDTPDETPAPLDPEAVALATLADVVGAGRSDNVKTVIMWIAINRSERAVEGHGKPLMEEINMPLQWQGYDPEQTYTYTQATYDIAVEVLAIRDSGGLRPIDNDMMWLVLNNDGSITIRNKYQGNNITEKTIK